MPYNIGIRPREITFTQAEIVYSIYEIGFAGAVEPVYQVEFMLKVSGGCSVVLILEDMNALKKHC